MGRSSELLNICERQAPNADSDVSVFQISEDFGSKLLYLLLAVLKKNRA